MAYTELDLAQLERRILAGERCVARQREILNQHVAAALRIDGALQLLAAFEATLCELRCAHDRMREQIAATTTQRLLTTFWSMPAPGHGSLTAN